MRGPAVPGATNYQELCMVWKTSLRPEKETGICLDNQTVNPTEPKQTSSEWNNRRFQPSQGSGPKTGQTCFYCSKPGQIMRDCWSRSRRERESYDPSPSGESDARGLNPASTKQILAGSSSTNTSTNDGPSLKTASVSASLPGSPVDVTLAACAPNKPTRSPYDLLFSDLEDEKVMKQVKVTDSGRRLQLAWVDIQGVPAHGLVDTAADVTIMGGKLFALVAASARLYRRSQTRVPRSYDMYFAWMAAWKWTSPSRARH